LQDKSVTWKHLARSVIVFVSKDARLESLIPQIKQDLGPLAQQSVVIRVDTLPMNALVEIEMICDAGPKHGNRLLTARQEYSDNLDSFTKD